MSSFPLARDHNLPTAPIHVTGQALHSAYSSARLFATPKIPLHHIDARPNVTSPSRRKAQRGIVHRSPASGRAARRHRPHILCPKLDRIRMRRGIRRRRSRKLADSGHASRSKFDVGGQTPMCAGSTRSQDSERGHYLGASPTPSQYLSANMARSPPRRATAARGALRCPSARTLAILALRTRTRLRT